MCEELLDVGASQSGPITAQRVAVDGIRDLVSFVGILMPLASSAIRAWLRTIWASIYRRKECDLGSQRCTGSYVFLGFMPWTTWIMLFSCG